MTISILIPVYNEERTVIKIIERVEKVIFPPGVGKEIIIVDDASGDATYKKLRKYLHGRKYIKLFQHSINKGKGAAVQTAISKAKGDIFVIQDADLEYNPSDLPRLVQPIIENKYQVVYGSRLMNFPLKLIGPGRTPLLSHYFGNKFLTLMTNVLYFKNITDMETCYKAFASNVIKKINIKSNRFNIEPEVTAKILKQGIDIHEIPIKVNPRGYKEGKKISWKDGFSAVWTLLKYRIID